MGQVVDLAVARERRGQRTDVLLTKAEVAAHFRVSPRTIERWVLRGMPQNKPFEGGSVRFVLPECEAWFSQRR